MKGFATALSGFFVGIILILSINDYQQRRSELNKSYQLRGEVEYKLAEAKWCRMTHTLINFEQIDSIYENIKTK